MLALIAAIGNPLRRVSDMELATTPSAFADGLYPLIKDERSAPRLGLFLFSLRDRTRSQAVGCRVRIVRVAFPPSEPRPPISPFSEPSRPAPRRKVTDQYARAKALDRRRYGQPHR